MIKRRVSICVRVRRIRRCRRDSVDERWSLCTLTPRGWVHPYAAVAATGDEAELLDHGKLGHCIYKLGFRVGVTNKPTHIPLCKGAFDLIYCELGLSRLSRSRRGSVDWRWSRTRYIILIFCTPLIFRECTSIFLLVHLIVCRRSINILNL